MKVFGFFSTGLSIDKDRDLNLKQMRERSDSRTISARHLGDRVPAPRVVSRIWEQRLTGTNEVIVENVCFCLIRTMGPRA